jgi:hypothetical protein
MSMPSQVIHTNTTLNQEPTQPPPPGPSGVSSHEHYYSTPGTSQRPQPRSLPSTVHPQPTVNTQVTINNPTQATYQDPTVANTYNYTHAYGYENGQNQQMANVNAQMNPRLYHLLQSLRCHDHLCTINKLLHHVTQVYTDSQPPISTRYFKDFNHLTQPNRMQLMTNMA